MYPETSCLDQANQYPDIKNILGITWRRIKEDIRKHYTISILQYRLQYRYEK